jgi:hypothetical protein
LRGRRKLTVFRSRIRPIIIPQYEHGRLAGILAQHWGNEQFDRPAMDFASFVQGVALHDWHYGFGDNLPIDGADEADWLAMARRGVTMRLDDPITDIVAKLHLRRLFSYDDSPERRTMMARIDDYVDGRLPETGHGRAAFDWADKITRFCDNVAFHFSFEAPYERTMMIGNRVDEGQETAITYQIKPNGEVIIIPWPFAVPFISGSIIGYQADDYPEVLRPLVVQFRVTGGND